MWRMLKNLGIVGNQRKRLVDKTTKAAERASRWLCRKSISLVMVKKRRTVAKLLSTWPRIATLAGAPS